MASEGMRLERNGEGADDQKERCEYPFLSFFFWGLTTSTGRHIHKTRFYSVSFFSSPWLAPIICSTIFAPETELCSMASARRSLSLPSLCGISSLSEIHFLGVEVCSL